MSLIPNRAIAEGEIACRVVVSIVPWQRPRWVNSQLTRGAWVVTFLSRKSCVLTISYNFWPSSKCSIQQIFAPKIPLKDVRFYHMKMRNEKI